MQELKIKENNIKNLFPDISQEWLYSKNIGGPENYTKGSKYNAWWKCKKEGHEWKTMVQTRIKSVGCPYCLGKKVSSENNLKKLYPEISKEWDYTKNKGDKPEGYTKGSNKLAWWICPKGHSYETTIKKRTSKNTKANCPYCSGRRVGIDNNLEYKFPEIAKEWHPTKNKNLKPNQFTYGSQKKVWWNCNEGHEYEADICSRTGGHGCPYCSNRFASKERNLKVLFPKIAKEWHPTKNKNEPEEYLPYSLKKVWWLCSVGHSYDLTIANRTSMGANCPFCSGHRVSKENNLLVNYPELAQEWHPTKNKKSKPSEYTWGSNKKAWWICKRGHEWEAVIGSRAEGRGCPLCSNQTSKPELRIYAELKKIYNDVELRTKVKGFEIDIFIPSLKIGIEYDGSYFHRNKEKIDKIKNSSLLKENIRIIRFREIPLSKITGYDIIVSKDIFLKENLNNLLISLKDYDKINRIKIIDYILKKNFLADAEYNTLISNLPGPPREKSLGSLNKKISSEWDLIKNYPLTPFDFTIASKHKVWWLCEKDHSYDLEIQYRTKKIKAYNCPICSGRRVSDENSLKTLRPDLIKEWDFEKNKNLSPENFTPGSHNLVWWKCRKGHSWKTKIFIRTKGSNCPYCSKKKINNDNSLANTQPEMMQDWDYEYNINIDPKKISDGSTKIVLWNCSKGHSWKAKVINRRNAKGCPYCKKILPSSDYNLKATYPDITKDWDFTKNKGKDPKDILPNSMKKYWWKCKNNHMTYESCNYRVKNKIGCKICRKEIKLSLTSLSTEKPELIKEWNFKKNKPLKPANVFARSDKRVWWICSKKHEWQAVIYSRVRGHGCPYCSGRKTTKNNSIFQTHPSIIKDWHYEKNSNESFYRLSKGSAKIVWWKCQNGHEYQKRIYSKIKSPRCPECLKDQPSKKVKKENSLVLNYPQIKKYWDYKRNKKINIDLYSKSSSEEVWWKCVCGYEFKRKIYYLTSRFDKYKCPSCKKYLFNKN